MATIQQAIQDYHRELDRLAEAAGYGTGEAARLRYQLDRRRRQEVERALTLPPLTDNQRLILEIIHRHPEGIRGKDILREAEKHGVYMEQSSLTRHVLPVLKTRGVKNQAGAGYYLPT